MIVYLDSDCVSCKMRDSVDLPPLPSFPAEVFSSRSDNGTVEPLISSL